MKARITLLWSIVRHCVLIGLALLSFSDRLWAQTATYHLHMENSSTSGLLQLRPSPPDSGVIKSTLNLRNKTPGEYLIKAFDTQAGVPNQAGTIAPGTTVSFTLWMRKDARAGTMYPRAKLLLNSATGTPLCTATGTTALNDANNPTKYILSCTTTAAVTVNTSDRYYLWIGVNLTSGPGRTNVNGEVSIEGTPNGNYDSHIVVPLPGKVCGLGTGDLNTVESKVLLFSFNPVLENKGGVTLREYLVAKNYKDMEWTRPHRDIATEFLNNLSTASRGKNSDDCPAWIGKLVDEVYVDAWPVYSDGFQYTDESFIEDFEDASGNIKPTFVFHRGGDAGALSDIHFFQMANLDRRVMNGEVDEVIVLTNGPVIWESWMVGEGSFWINGAIWAYPHSKSTRAYPIHYACYECFGHRLEHILDKMFGERTAGGSPLHAWDRFARIDSQQPGNGNIGFAHRPFNAQAEYDFKNTVNASTNEEDWYNYPMMTGDPALRKQKNCTLWGCKENPAYGSGPIDGYALWMLQHLPRTAGVNNGTGFGATARDQGMLNNWWRYLFDVDQFKLGDGRINPDSTPPAVAIQASPDASNLVTVTVAVTDENPIYRVDLYYVDATNREVYVATDTMRPYVFHLTSDTSVKYPFEAKILPGGIYNLRAKAYSMPDGLQGVSFHDDTKLDTRPITLIGGCSLALSASGSTKVTARTPMSLTLSVNQGATISTRPDDLPLGATFTTNGSTATFAWTPRFDQRGAQWIRFTARNSSGCQALKDVKISVESPKTLYETTNQFQLKNLNLWNTVVRGDGSQIKTGMNILSLAVDPRDPNVSYAGTEGKGFYRTRNNGIDGWQQINNGLIKSNINMVNGTAVAAAANPYTLGTEIYAGTRYPGGLYKWNDSQGTWNHEQSIPVLGPDNVAGYFSLAIDPTYPYRVFAGTNNVPTAQNVILNQAGLSTSVLDPVNSFAEGLTLSPISRYYPHTMYAGFGYSGQYQTDPAKDPRVYKSVTYGAPGEWADASSDLPAKSEVHGIDMAFDSPGVVFAAIPDGSSPGIYRTMNGGGNWIRVLDIPCRSVRISPFTSYVVIAGCDEGIFLNRDALNSAGTNWEYIGSAGRTNAIVFATSQRVVIGTGHGLFGSVYELLLPF